MKRLTRQVFIEQTCALLNERGRIDFALSDLLDACGAQKGSLYHFFPNGKDELVVSAVDHMSNCALRHIHGCLDAEASVADAVYRQVTDLADWVEQSSCSIAIPFTAIAAITGADNEEVRSACESALHQLESAYLESLMRDGLGGTKAKSLAAFIVTAIEGAFLLSRTINSSCPLRNAATNLRLLISLQLENAAP